MRKKEKKKGEGRCADRQKLHQPSSMTGKDSEEMQGRAGRKWQEKSCRAEPCSPTCQAKANCPTGGGRGGLDCTENSEPHLLFASLTPVCSVCPRKCSNSCEPWGYCESFVQPIWSYGSWSWLLRKFSFLKSQTYERNGETIDPILVLVFGSRKIQILIRFW